METTKEIRRYLQFKRKIAALRLGKELGHKCACEVFKISKSSYYNWKRKYDQDGEEGLLRQRRDPASYWNSSSQEVIDLILKLQDEYKLGSWRIKWYLERYHDISISESTVYRTLKRNGVKRLDRAITRKAMGPQRYSKETPGHHVQIDVKFLNFRIEGETVKRYQYTAIDDCTRIRAMKVYDKHNQQGSIDFLNYVVDKFPFRIHTIQTDNGHEFQSKFNWHVQDKGMTHRFIKPGKP